jgi:hypothetical protein
MSDGVAERRRGSLAHSLGPYQSQGDQGHRRESHQR